MDIGVIMIVILLFIPIYLMGIVSNSRVLTVILASILVGLVVVFAGEKYIYFDVLGIGVALFFAFLHTSK
ncbi:MAG: hypothetical protein GXP61_00125 [Epsilonproteobacteria bacterium]|nr:hypothetical protein [Campylobacterota bacterium]